MKYSYKIIVLAWLLLTMAIVALPETASAGSSWQWLMSLRTDKVGDSMYMPSSVSFDKQSERYYVIDTGRNRLVSFGLDGKLDRAFTANDQLKSPFDIVRLDNGKLWVVEKGRNSLTLIDVAAKKIQVNILKDGERLVFPDRLAEFEGKLYVLDRSSGQILRLNDNMSIDQRFGCSDCSMGMIDFIIRDGVIFALAPQDKKVYRFKLDGSVADEIALSGNLDFPVSLDIGPAGSIYVLDRHQNSILVFSGSGQYRYRFLGSGQAAGKVYFARQLRFDPWGRLCVVDEGNGRVEIFRQ
jgi:DNA-binding beta-propeller fold protein YncE